MKTYRVLLALVILLAMNSLAASAQASASTSFAYISLLPASQVVSSSGESTLPVEMLSQRTYEHLFPALLHARQQGLIVQFQPEFSAGMVKVEYLSGVNLAPLLGERFSIYSDPSPILENLWMFGRRTSNSQEIPALTTPRFSLLVKNSSFSGYNFPADRYLKFTLSDPSGKLMAVADAYTQSNGYFWAYFGEGNWSAMEPGYTFSAKMYLLDRTTLVKTFSTTIPNLRISSIDVASKTVKGTAPVNGNLRVELYHLNLNAFGGSSATTNFLVAPASGAWQTTFATPMRGNDYVWVDLEPGGNFSFSTYLTAPSIHARLGSNYGYLYGSPNTAASMTIRHTGIDYPFSGKFSNRGYFYGELFTANGAPIFLQAGDKLSCTGVTALTLPVLTASLDAATDIVSGTAPAGKYLDVYIYVQTSCGEYSCWHWYGDYIKSTVAGTFALNFSEVVDILPTDTLEIDVYYLDPVTGNESYYYDLISP